MKKLRSQLADAREALDNAKADSEKAQKAALKAEKLAKSNKELEDKLTAADQRVKDLEKQAANKAERLSSPPT